MFRVTSYFHRRKSSQAADLSSSENSRTYHNCLFCDYTSETAVGMAGHYRQIHADLLEHTGVHFIITVCILIPHGPKEARQISISINILNFGKLDSRSARR